MAFLEIRQRARLLRGAAYAPRRLNSGFIAALLLNLLAWVKVLRALGAD